MKTVQINNKPYQECDVVMLPTDKADGCLLKGFKTLQYYPKEFFTQEYLKSSNRKSEHLYILSNDEIKEVDWVYSKSLDLIYKVERLPLSAKDSKKIIATTNSSLKTYNEEYDPRSKTGREWLFLPQIPQQFIEYFISEYNKGNVISKVLVETEPTKIRVGQYSYIDSEELKINQNNEISILTEEKQMFSREEVIYLLHKVIKDCDSEKLLEHYSGDYSNLNNWIQQNLK
jgi:hypothetical protein